MYIYICIYIHFFWTTGIHLLSILSTILYLIPEILGKEFTQFQPTCAHTCLNQ